MELYQKQVIRQREVGTILELIEDVEIDQEYDFEERGAKKMKAAIVEKILAYALFEFIGYHESVSDMDEIELPWTLIKKEVK